MVRDGWVGTERGTSVMKPRTLALAAALAGAGLVAPGPAAADELFLRLQAPLDEPRGFCLDIPGHRAGVRLERPLHAHSCKHFIWHRDGIFDTAAFERGALRMPEYDLCVEAATAEPEALVGLKKCDASPLQTWRRDTSGNVVSGAAPDRCLTVGPGPSRPAGADHIVRTVRLMPCASDSAERQRWVFSKPGG